MLAARDEQNAALRRRLEELGGLVAALRAQLGRDSSNSSRPPLSDWPFVKKPAAKRSPRTRSGRKPGKQPGSEGTTLRLVEEPDDVVVLAPSACGGCGGDLAAGNGSNSSVGRSSMFRPRRRGRM